MADSAENLSNARLARQFLIGLFNPELFGAYVLITILCALVGGAFYFGFGCVFRMGGFLFLFFLPVVLVGLLLAVFGAWLAGLVVARSLEARPVRFASLVTIRVLLQSFVRGVCWSDGQRLHWQLLVRGESAKDLC